MARFFFFFYSFMKYETVRMYIVWKKICKMHKISITIKTIYNNYKTFNRVGQSSTLQLQFHDSVASIN